MIYYETAEGLVEATDYYWLRVCRAVDECSQRHRRCRGCGVRRECRRWWDNVAVDVACERDCVVALAEFRLLAPHEDALDDRDEHLGKAPHKTDRQREQHDPLEQAPVSTVQKRVVPQ